MLGANDEIVICVKILACWAQIHETIWCLLFFKGGGVPRVKKKTSIVVHFLHSIKVLKVYETSCGGCGNTPFEEICFDEEMKVFPSHCTLYEEVYSFNGNLR